MSARYLASTHRIAAKGNTYAVTDTKTGRIVATFKTFNGALKRANRLNKAEEPSIDDSQMDKPQNGEANAERNQ